MNKTNVPNFLFSWEDVKSAREKESGKTLNGLSIVNDSDREAREDLILALHSKGTDVILWSERNKPANLDKIRVVG